MNGNARRGIVQRRLAATMSVVLTGALLLVGPATGSEGWEAKVDASVLERATAGQTEFIAYMADRADLAAAAGFATKEQKGAFVYELLSETARRSQAALLAQLDDLGAPHRSFWISNAVLVTGGLDVLEAVAARSDVQAVFAAGKGRLDPPVDVPGGTESVEVTTAVGPSIAHVRADQAWQLGYRGQGVVVAGADTGVRWTHSALKGQYRGWDATSGTADHNYNWRNAAGPNVVCPADDAQPCDDHDHGTHTVGTIVGDDGGSNQVGVAPDAEWIACRNMNQGFGAVPTYMDCMQWFIAPTDLAGNNPDPSRAPDVVNNSWGCVEACAPPLLKDMVDASRAAGIFYVVSAGNDNQFFLGTTMACNTINFPLAVYKSAFTVGATGATNDEIADFSSLGPVASNPIDGLNYRKPDIVAPGVGIRSATSGSDNAYGSSSGTSMAGPHVAGVVALVISANPELRGQIDAIEDIIEQTAVPLTSDLGCGTDSSTQVPNNVYGWGRIDALAAVQLAAGFEPEPTPTPTPTPTPSPTPEPDPGCEADNVWFLGIVYDEALREDFQADVRNFEHYLATLRGTYCIPDSQATIMAMDEGYRDAITGETYSAGSEANLKAELRRMGAEANAHGDSLFFFFLSSHGNVWSGALPNSACPPERLTGSFAALGEGGGEDGLLDDCELGAELTNNFAPETRMFVAVDCSFCGGFSDSLTATSGTIEDGNQLVGSGVPAPNRIVITGCAITTECFGSDPAENGGVTYHHLREVLEGTVACDGWTAPGFPEVQGFDVPVNGEPHRALDGDCTASEWFFAAVWSAYSSGDVIGIQQQFRIKYGLPSLDDDILIVGGNGPDPTPIPTPEPRPDLVISDIIVSRDSPRASEPVTVTAIVENVGDGPAEASQTLFAIDGAGELGRLEAGALAPGESLALDLEWDTRGLNGEHVVRVTADVDESSSESDEQNNWATRTVTVRGNRVENGSFEQASADPEQPAAWQGQSTGAGSAAWSEGGSDGQRSVTISGTGKSVAVHGAPSWTSAPIAVSPGERLTLSAQVHSSGLSSAPNLGLAYLGPAGELLSTVSLLTAPLNTEGFSALEETLSVPAGVSQLRIVLYGFAATDLATSGTVTFDDIGLYEE